MNAERGVQDGIQLMRSFRDPCGKAPLINIVERSRFAAGGWSRLVTSTGFPFAATASVPTAVGYVILSGTIVFSAIFGCCLTCFFLCPTLSLVLKIIAFVLAGCGLFGVVYSLGYYYQHMIYHG